MNNELIPQFFYTAEGSRIFFKTNFPLDKYNKDIPLLVFNYGLVCNESHFEKQLPYFIDKGLQVLVHDYRGHYSSSGSENLDEINFENISSDTEQLIASITEENVIMIGHSMGTNISMEFARRHPTYLKGMVLISGTVVPPQDIMFDSNIIDIVTPYWLWITENAPKLYGTLWKTAFMNPLARKIVHSGGFNTKKVPVEFINVYMSRLGKLHPGIFLKLIQEMHDHDIINHLENIETPTLIMGGDKDQIIPNYLQGTLHRFLPNSELYIIKDGSHVPQVDFPETVNERILRFINRL